MESKQWIKIEMDKQKRVTSPTVEWWFWIRVMCTECELTDERNMIELVLSCWSADVISNL